MKLISGIVDSGFFAQSALSAEVATKDSLGRNISETYLTGVDLTPYQTTAGMTAYTNSAEVTGTAQYGLTTAGWSEITGGGGVTGDFELKEGNGIQLTDDPIAQTTTISVSGDYATNTQLQNVSADITAMIPTALTGDYLDKASADTLYYPLNSNPNNYLTTAYTPDFAYHDSAISAIDESAIYDTSAHARINTLAGRINTLSSVKADVTALADYQTIAGMTAYMTTGDSAEFMTTAERSDYIPTGVSSEFYTTANESGFISEVPVGTMNESAFSYDASDNITAYNGSAFKAGDEFPQSATEAIETVTANSADWNGTTETVSSNSGAWGGSALPVSAGNGVKISLQNDTLVFEADETILWEGTATSASWPITLSESTNNFKSFKIDWCPYTEVSNWTAPYDTVNTKLDNGTMHLLGQGLSDNGTYAMMSNLLISANDDTLTKLQFMSITMHGSVMECGSLEGYKIYKVVGINRIAGE